MKRGAVVIWMLGVVGVLAYVAYARGWIPTAAGPSFLTRWDRWLGAESATAFYSGTLEATRIQVMSQVPARVLEVTVEEGDTVTAGQVVIRLDDTLLQRQLDLARAEIRLAEAQLALLRAGPRPEERAKAEAEVKAAQAAVAAARQALADAQAIYEAAQDLQPDIVRAETELAKARHLRDAALAQAQAADLLADLWARAAERAYGGVTVTLPNGQVQRVPTPPDKLNDINYQWNLASQRQWQAWARYRQAEAAVQAAAAALEAARARLNAAARKQPVVEAEAALAEAEAALQVAEAQRAALDRAVTEEAIAAAEANVRRTQAAYRRLLAQQAFYTLTAPIHGRVLSRDIEPGEVALPGTPLLELADLSTLRLTVYVPEADLGQFRVGQEVFVWVDAYPGEGFPGRVARIADEAEFTPKNVQTREERTILVYAVEIEVPNPEGRLKPGMPADVTLDAVPPPPVAANVAAAPEDLFSGTLEARKVRIMPEVTARVLEVPVPEGAVVQEGEVALRLDPGPLAEQVREAEAALEAAQARLADLQARPLPEQVAVARAAVAQAQARLDAARRRLDLAREALEHPVELEAQIRQVQARLALLEQQLDEARARHKEAVVTRDYYRSDFSDEGRTRYRIGEKQVAAAEANIRAVEAEIAGTRRLLATLQDIRKNPLALIAQVRRAEGEVRVAKAQLDVAQKALALAEAPARDEEIAQAQADVERARAALALVQAQRARYTLVAPVGGTVLTVNVHPGEVAQAGTAALEIADISRLEVTIFVPEAQLGHFRLGQRVDVFVDAYPGRAFPGTVVWIADEAEFTPKNVQTRNDRTQTVFRVKVQVPNPEGLLKAGMPADVRLRE